MLEDQAELESLLKIDISFRIEQWRKAWQRGDYDEYMSFYSENFIPQNITIDRWVEQRRERISPTKNINLKLSNFEVEFDSGHQQGTVQFNQDYSAGSFQESSRKQLVLLREQQAWKIISETELTQ